MACRPSKCLIVPEGETQHDPSLRPGPREGSERGWSAAMTPKEPSALDDRAWEQQSAWRTQLILDHRLFAQNVARKLYRHSSTTGVDYEDLEGAAMVGLCDAAQRFSGDKGTQFKTFAYFRIRGAVYDLLRRHGGVPRRRYRQSREQLAEGVVTPTKDAEVVESLGIRLHASGESADVSYLDARSPEATAVVASTARHLAQSVAALPEPERRLIQLHYYQGISFTELRHTFGGASKSWVSRLHQRALKQLHARVA